MCSSARGPATVPSLVTCPMMKTGTCVPFASCISRSVDSRTWLMLPGAQVTFHEATVWIASPTVSGGRLRAATRAPRLDEASPLATVGAATRPLRALVAALLADELHMWSWHRYLKG